MSLLRVDDVHKSYGHVMVLRGISFEMERGEIKVIIAEMCERPYFARQREDLD
jgi:ABC-type histidine transport system ATPase subunit